MRERKTVDNRFRPRVGDIIEIETNRGFDYIQYIERMKENSAAPNLIRCIGGLHQSRPESFENFSRKPHIFQATTWLSPPLRRGDWRIVHNGPVPDFAK